uniref:Uncharacterized protein n=1 Tax=Anguilla anguilla TaxID=7936 RepID=A0A0E9QXX8_ANGAN
MGCSVSALQMPCGSPKVGRQNELVYCRGARPDQRIS